MMRRMLLALCLIPAMLMAEEELKMYSHVYLKLHSGEVYEIPIEHGSKMHSYALGSGTEAYFVVDITGKECFYQFRREEIAIMKLVEDTEHVDIDTPTIENDVHASKLQYKLGELKVHHTLEGARITIVNTQGHVVYTGMVEEPYAVNLGFLGDGIYIAKVNEHTLKIKK